MPPDKSALFFWKMAPNRCPKGYCFTDDKMFWCHIFRGMSAKFVSFQGEFSIVSIFFRKLPPGPWSIPFLGVLYRISSEQPHLTYTEWNKKYGDVMSFTLFGTQRAVVVSSEEAIRDVFINKQDQFSGIKAI